MRKTLALGLPVAVAFIASSAHADEASVKHSADSLAKAFVGGCVQVMPNVDRVETSAKALGWKEVDQTAVAVLAPASPTAKWKGWLVEEVADVPFFLGISQDTANGKNVSVCAVANPYAPAAPVHAALTKMLTLGQPIESKIEGGQQYTYWTTKIMDKEIIISLIDATPMDEAGVNITVTSIQEGSCEIDDSKKRVINAFLCGQMAAESQYHFSGSDCLANSAQNALRTPQLKSWATEYAANVSSRTG